ncbi:hypothetical protein [Montanilutibacter psychrotolerans]|uniref:Secreted protein n=1 Tax=Montanilutibacter psychrotolerans TaxID=1327343 RepID=A0A3M8SXW6_9GAMM|nr:hypothetical protein [Lysobacter psychrotolerans]RNF86139.1 hypothetical protein EER27_01525 [Lysobacter psychrotolerans]
MPRRLFCRLTFILALAALLSSLPALAQSASTAKRHGVTARVAPSAGINGQVGRYTDVGSYLVDEASIEAWYTATHRLREQFDDICGDTFCEGDYSNLQELRYTCSVDRVSGILGQCVWGFAGSIDEVDPYNGRVLVDARAWQCVTPLAPRTTVAQLITVFAGGSPLYALLPGTDRSIYDGLVDCL